MQVRAARLARAASACALLLLGSNAIGNPTGPQVVSGSATVTGLGTNNVTVTNGGNAVINWQGFSIGAGQTTQFVQPSASSAVLNRVVGPNVSSISGSLQSNGRIFLINPNGALFGAGAQINTAAFTVSTTNVSDAQFLAAGGIGNAMAISAAGSLSVQSGEVSIGTGNTISMNAASVLTIGGDVALGALTTSGTHAGSGAIVTVGSLGALTNTATVTFAGDNSGAGRTLAISSNPGSGITTNFATAVGKTNTGSLSITDATTTLTSTAGTAGNLTILSAGSGLSGTAPLTLAAAPVTVSTQPSGPAAPVIGVAGIRSASVAAPIAPRTGTMLNLQKREPIY